MTDDSIISLLNCRDEAALSELKTKYGRTGRHIATEILRNEEDAREVFQDALMRIWNAIPPEKPDNLSAYLNTVIKRLAYNKHEMQNAAKH